MTDTIYIEKYVPDYESECVNCGQTPCVTAVDDCDDVVYESGMCGPCTFGEAACIDHRNWNEHIGESK